MLAWLSILVLHGFHFTLTDIKIEPWHKKTWLLIANNKGTDQTAQMRSLLSAFVISCLEYNS